MRHGAAVRALVVAVSILMPCVACGDVVPPRAVEVAESWLRLVDGGRIEPAVRATGSTEAEAVALRTRLRASRRAVRTRMIRSWGGHGAGDTQRMEPGGYFALVFDTVDANGAEGSDEVRLVPTGHDDWRVVGFCRR